MAWNAMLYPLTLYHLQLQPHASTSIGKMQPPTAQKKFKLTYSIAKETLFPTRATSQTTSTNLHFHTYIFYTCRLSPIYHRMDDSSLKYIGYGKLLPTVTFRFLNSFFFFFFFCVLSTSFKAPLTCKTWLCEWKMLLIFKDVPSFLTLYYCTIQKF